MTLQRVCDKENSVNSPLYGLTIAI